MAKLAGTGLALVLLVGIAWLVSQLPRQQSPPLTRLGPTLEFSDGMVLLPGGTYLMGSATGPRDQQPRHEVVVAPFWLDRREVSNDQFAEFVDATGYVTTAEVRGYSMVFDPQAGRWGRVEAACWRQPGGPESTVAGRENLPVVHVSWHDAARYAEWRDARLPTEAEWEYAARGGLFDAEFPWGRTETPAGRYQANYWQGWFPSEDRALDGFADLAPCGSFAPNAFGLWDMSGNACEWCSDWYADDTYQPIKRDNPTGSRDGTHRVHRGGSWLSAENHSMAIRVATRASAQPGDSTNHLGFRCAGDQPR